MLLLLALLYLIQREQSHGYKVIPSRTYTSGTFLTLMPYAQQQQHQQQQRRQRAWNTAACAAPKSWDQEACRLTAGIPTAPGLLVRLVRYTHVWSAANRSSRVYVCVCVCVVCVFVCVCVRARKAAEEKKRENTREATLASMLTCTHALLARTTPCTRRNIHFQTHAYTCSYANTRTLLLSLRGRNSHLLSKNKFLPKKKKKQKRLVSGQPSKLSTAFIGY